MSSTFLQANELFQQGPFGLLKQIVAAHSSEGSGEPRVILHTSSGHSWTGTPVGVTNDRSSEYVVLALLEKNRTLALAVNEIVAVEVIETQALNKWLAQPWLGRSEFSAQSKLAAERILATQWPSSLPACHVQFESFPNQEEAFGFAAGWSLLLKAELEKILAEFGSEPLSSIKSVELVYTTKSMSCHREQEKIICQVNMSAESLNRGQISAQLKALL